MKLSNIRKLLYILSWIPVMLLHTFPLVPLAPFIGWWALSPVGILFLGLITVPIALLFPRWPKLLWLWGNDEEGCPDWWLTAAKKKNWIIRALPYNWWYAFRNPVNNMRFIFKDPGAEISGNWTEASMEPQDLIDRNMRVAYRWNYNGLFAGYRRVTINYSIVVDDDVGHLEPTYTELWIGWKVGSTVPGLGFTTQYRRNRKIGT